MKLKSKYNVGDIVRFYNEAIPDDDIGRIYSVNIKFSIETLQQTSYKVTPIRMNNNYSVEIYEFKIKEKLNKKAFEKAYTEHCAKEMLKK